MPKHAKSSAKRRVPLILASSLALGGIALASAGVYAALTAQATGTQSVATGGVSLTVGADGTTTGFTTAVTNMAPGDTQNRFVSLTNASTIATQGLTLSASGTANNLLDATKGLTATVTSCTVAWTIVSTTPTCTGTTSVLLAATPLANLTSTTSGNLVSGTVAAAYHLELTLALPNTVETTLNGAVPGSTIQNLTNSITFTFSETQRAATSTSA